MAIRTILTEGDPKLTKVCHPVTKFDQKLADLLDDMVETLEASGGVGLAAPRSASCAAPSSSIPARNFSSW